MLTLTESAKNALTTLLKKTDLKDPVVTILRPSNIEGKDQGWSIAVCRKETFTPEEIFEENGFIFYIDDQWKEAVSKITIDYKNGRFQFE